MKKLLCLSLAALVSTSSIAADWLYIGSNNTDDKVYIDMSSIDKNVPYTRFWSKIEPKKSKIHNTLNLKEIKVLYEISCSSKQIRGLSYTFIYFDDRLDSLDEPQSWNYIPPDRGQHRKRKL